MTSLAFFARRFPQPAAHVPFLAPWWGAPREDAASLHLGQFDAWAASQNLPMHEVDSPEKADFFVLSIPWKAAVASAEGKAFAEAELANAGRLGKRIVIFFDADHDYPVDWPAHAVVFRFSIYSDQRHPSEFSIPTFSQDFLVRERGGQLQPRVWTPVPSVGFCGYAPPLGCSLGKKTLLEALRYLNYRLGRYEKQRARIAHAIRVRAIRRCQASSRVQARFILRDQFAFNQWGVLQPGGTEESARRQRREFLDNLDSTDYALCARGLANCSIRFYEALSLGRVPVFINSKCSLPYDFVFDWKQVCFWIEEEEVGQLPQRLHAFHASLSPEAFRELQVKARQAFVDWIRPEAFFRRLPAHWIKDWDLRA